MHRPPHQPQDPVILAPPSGDTQLAMWMKSLGGTLLGLTLGLLNLLLLWPLCAGLNISLLAVLIASLIAGATQGSMLHNYTRPPVLWLAATGACWLLAYWMIGWPDLSLKPVLWLDQGTPMLFGLISSVGQWLLLRRHVGRASYWLWISVVCWYLIWLLSDVFIQS